MDYTTTRSQSNRAPFAMCWKIYIMDMQSTNLQHQSDNNFRGISAEASELTF